MDSRQVTWGAQCIGVDDNHERGLRISIAQRGPVKQTP
jgi:hypothetical protein